MAVGALGFQAWPPSRALSSTPSWWKKGRPRRVHGSLPEVQLLSHLAVLLKPQVPIAELFRDFPTERSADWGASILSPDLALYGLLKSKAAGLFLEYDGHYQHYDASGLVADERKTEALLCFAPPGSVVLRIAHAHRGLKARQNCVEIVIDRWNACRKQDVFVPLQQVSDALLRELNGALHAPLRRQLQDLIVASSGLCFKDAGNFVDDAQVRGGDRELRLVQLYVFLEKVGLSQVQNAKVVACFPPVLGYCIEANLKPTVEWLRDLGLSQAQVAKVVACFPSVLGYSIEANLKPTVEWLRDLGLSQAQVVKIVAGFPQVLGYSIEANLKPTVEWLRDLGLSQGQVAKIVAGFPQVLGCSIEANLKPTVEWLRDLGLSQAQVAKVVACFPSVLGYSIEANLKPTVEWLRDLGLSQAQVAKIVAGFPQVLGCSIEANLKPTVEWLRDLGLSQGQVAKVVACFPSVLGCSIEANLNAKKTWLQHFYTQTEFCEIVAAFPQLLGYSLQRLQRRLLALQKIGRLSLVRGLMARTDSYFDSYVLRHSCVFRGHEDKSQVVPYSTHARNPHHGKQAVLDWPKKRGACARLQDAG